jgi:Co/Zn/Cd efflux system component
LLDDQRAALSFIAIITGFMACIEGVYSMRFGSTAMLADALNFLQHSVSASVASWAATMAFARSRLAVQLQGIAMMILGTLVCVAAFRRSIVGSVPHPFAMIVMGLVALFGSLSCGFIVLHHRRLPTTLSTVWRIALTDVVSNVALIAAAVAVAVTRSNIPDLVIGGGMAALFVLSGWRLAVRGQTVDRQLP